MHSNKQQTVINVNWRSNNVSLIKHLHLLHEMPHQIQQLAFCVVSLADLVAARGMAGYIDASKRHLSLSRHLLYLLTCTTAAKNKGEKFLTKLYLRKSVSL